MALQSQLSTLSPDAGLFKIEPACAVASSIPIYYLQAVQELVENAIPDSFSEETLCNHQKIDIGAFFYRLSKALPIVKHNPIHDNALSIPLTFLIPGEYTQGAGRYIPDTLARWLIPGRHLSIVGQISLHFRFSAFPAITFFLVHLIVHTDQHADVPMIRSNLPKLIEELKVNIMAVYYARYITSLRSSPMLHKNMIIEENISSMLNRKGDQSLYDQMQLFFAKSNAESKIDEIKRNISHLLTTRPKAFDRDVFYEINSFSALFKEPFSSMRNPRHLSRVIAYQYLFKKVLTEKVTRAPNERHLSLKVMRTTLGESGPIAAVLFGFNLLKDTERFEVKHLMEAIKSCMPRAQCPPESVIADRRHDKTRFFYFELVQGAFTHEEMQSLKLRLPQEILRQIENVVHPVFMPRNDEELMRNLIVLNNQIKYKRDLPQISIHYDSQSESELTFTVILVRLLFKSSPPLGKRIQETSNAIKFTVDDVRIAGYLKNKYPKEAAILRVSLDKTPFFRPDYSVDLLRARQKIAHELRDLLGEYRDFNGGIILKQDESLFQLRSRIGPLSEEKELLLENYFYSLRPGIMQTVYDPLTLKVHFEQLLKAIEFPLASLTHQTFAVREGKFLLCFIKAIAPSFKEPLIDAIAALHIPSYDLTTTFLQVGQTALMGMILRMDDRKEISPFFNTLNESLKSWSDDLVCSVSTK